MILVMKDGDIVEQGTHEELLLKNGFTRSFTIPSLKRPYNKRKSPRQKPPWGFFTFRKNNFEKRK